MFFKTDRIRDRSYLEHLRSLPCCVPGCDQPTEAAHLRYGGEGGMGLKPADNMTNPLCRQHHLEQHHDPLGEANFWMERVIKASARLRYEQWKQSR